MTADPEKRIRQIVAAINAHDIESVLSFFADAFVWEEVIAGPVVARNKEELRDRLQGLFAMIPDIKVALNSHFAIGNRECVEWTSSGTHTGDAPGFPATGKKFSYREAVVMELIGEKINRFSLYCDLMTFMRQLGLLPSDSKE